MSKSNSKSLKAISEIFDGAVFVLEKHDIPQELVTSIAKALCEQIVFQFGGREPYIPTIGSFRKQSRDENIWEQFRGDNYGDLAGKYEISERAVRKIEKKMRAKDRTQKSLAF